MSLSSVIAAAVVAFFVIEGVLLGKALVLGWELSRSSSAFQRTVNDASHRLLVVGDSTAVGTGAQPDESVAGRLAALLPNVSVVNLAENGAKAADLVGQLEAAPDLVFDAVLVQIGGNDILRFTRLSTIRQAMHRALQIAHDKAGLVVLMSTGDVGIAPGLPFPINQLYSWRTPRVHAVLRDAAQSTHTEYVDLYTPSLDDPFVEEPERFHAYDGLHPSASGYAAWTTRLVEDSSIIPALGGEQPTG
jgi:lysophospholipase L1-like esterase